MTENTINWHDEAIKHTSFAVQTRCDIHQNPELGFCETRTAAIITDELNRLGIETQTAVGGTGVLGRLQGQSTAGTGRHIVLRVDMDALPVQEKSDHDYVSQVDGVMHACGHDGHVAIGLTVARLLSQYREMLPGTVSFLFQPAEEGVTGAKGAPAVIKAGVFNTETPDLILGVHLWNYMPLGWVAVTPGPLMASIDFFKITLRGKGGHAAAPHENTDPVVAACELVTAIQSVVSRNIDPVDAAVVSVTMLKAGESPNVTPDEVTIGGTIRALDPETREKVIERVIRLSSGIGRSYGCGFDYQLYGSNPAVVNDSAIAERIAAAAQQNFTDWQVDTDYRTTVSEDFACYLDHVPGCFILVGSANPQKGLTEAHHSPFFDFDEMAMPRAAALLCAAIMDQMTA